MSHWPIKRDTTYARDVPHRIRIGCAAATLNFTVYYVTEPRNTEQRRITSWLCARLSRASRSLSGCNYSILFYAILYMFRIRMPFVMEKFPRNILLSYLFIHFMKGLIVSVIVSVRIFFEAKLLHLEYWTSIVCPITIPPV